MEKHSDAKNKLKVAEKELKDLRSKYGKAVSEKYRALRVASVELSAKIRASQDELKELKDAYYFFERDKYQKPIDELIHKLSLIKETALVATIMERRLASMLKKGRS